MYHMHNQTKYVYFKKEYKILTFLSTKLGVVILDVGYQVYPFLKNFSQFYNATLSASNIVTRIYSKYSVNRKTS